MGVSVIIRILHYRHPSLQIMKPCSSLCMGDCKHLDTPPSLLMDDSSIPAKQTNTFSINRRKVSSCTVISLIFVFFLFSSANALSQLDPINGIRFGWNKRGGGGSVNFSPGWGKRSNIPDLIHPDENLQENDLEISSQSEKRSGGSVNFSPGWGKRSGGSVNFSPSWGKRNAAWNQAPQIFRENLLQGNQGKYDSHLFKILLENFYGKNILDRIGAIKNNDNENETEPSVQNIGTQKRADAWLDRDNYAKMNREYLNENMLGTHRDWKKAAEGDDTSSSD